MDSAPITDRARDLGLRFVAMVLFVVIVQAVELVLGLVILVQFLCDLFTGRTFGELRRMGAALGDYVRAILRFLTYDTEEKPFPFSPWRASEARGTAPEPGAQPG